MVTPVRAVIAGVACMALVIACAGAQKPATAPTSAEPGEHSTAAGATAPQTMPGDPRATIEELSQQIESEREQLGLAAPPPLASGAPPATPMSSTPLSTTDPTCRPAKTDRCTQSCTFSDSICSNAARICDIASQLTADTWAAEKCERAKQTCDAAHATCCSCQ